MALFRALETARPSKDRLFHDPYAIGFLDSGLTFTTRLSSYPLLGSIIRGYIQKKVPGAHSSALGCTKYIDDQLEQSIRTLESHKGGSQSYPGQLKLPCSSVISVRDCILCKPNPSVKNNEKINWGILFHIYTQFGEFFLM